MNDFIDPYDQYQMQNNKALHYDLEIDAEADANAPRRVTLPPSELVMGPGNGYKVSVGFQSADPKKRWKLHDTKKDGTPVDRPYNGCMVQYTVIDTPGGVYDGLTTGEYIMTNTSNRHTCSAQGLLQALGFWRKDIRTNAQFMYAIEQALAQPKLIIMHGDWEGQQVLTDPNTGNKTYERIEGLDSWRAFWQADKNKPVDAKGIPISPPPPGYIPPGRIETGSVDKLNQPIIYFASFNVVRREGLAAVGAGSGVNGQAAGNGFGGGMAQANPFGAQPQTNGFGAPPAGFGQPIAQQQQFGAPVSVPNYGAPPMQAPQGYAPQVPQAPLPPQPQASPIAPPPSGPQGPGTSPFQPPQPTAPWQQGAPTWVTGGGKA